MEDKEMKVREKGNSTMVLLDIIVELVVRCQNPNFVPNMNENVDKRICLERRCHMKNEGKKKEENQKGLMFPPLP